MKFGGTSLGDADCFRRVVEIIRAESVGCDVVTVVSAMSGVTNKLLQAAALAEMGKMSEASAILQELKTQHHAAVEALVADVAERQRLFYRLDDLVEECRRWYKEAALTVSVAPALRDLISGVGERLSAPILASALTETGTQAEALEATEVLVTTSLHGAADPLMIPTCERCEKILIPMLRKGVLPVVTGFIGATADGIPTTLGRGGSDYSATVLGAAVGADEVIIWTDVDGMLTADPRLVPMARTIPEISYREAAELAYFGAKVLHPKTLDPVMKHGIPVWIRNTFAPLRAGTKINLNSSNATWEAKALASVSEAAIVTLDGVASPIMEGCRRRTLSSASTLRAHVLMNSQAESGKEIHLVLAGNPVEAIEKALRDEFRNELASGDIQDIRCSSGVAILTVVGQNLEGIREIVHCATNELIRQNVKVFATGQNSSDCSVSFVVHSDQVNTALAAAHHALQMRSSDPAQRRRPEQVFEYSGLALSEQRRRTRPGEQVTAYAGGDASGDQQARECVILDEASFRRMIALERKRSERSRKPMLLMLFDAGSCLPFDRSGRVLSNILSALSLSTRDTDVAGWYKEHSVVGVMFTEISLDDHGEILGTMMHRVSQTLKNNLTLEKFSQIGISMHLFPEAWS
jgi:aspartate kinase